MADNSYIKGFEDFWGRDLITEGLVHGDQATCNKAFINGGDITFYYRDGSTKTVSPKEIVEIVDETCRYLEDQYTKTFEFANESLNIIYLAHSEKYKTMAVDAHMNMYLNASFVYNVLKMDKKLIGAVIMHEVFHALFNHIERGANWLSAHGKPVNEYTNWETNLAADIEVNQMLVRSNIITEDRLINEIRGLYLKNRDGLTGSNTNVVTMETILDNEEIMNKLKEMSPFPSDQTEGNQESIKTTAEWNDGYKAAWNKICELVKKYGYKDAWQKLQDAGLVNAVGEINTGMEIEDINSLQFIQVKYYDEYLNEDLNPKPSDKGQTYDDGYITGLQKVLGKLYQAIEGQQGGGAPGGGGGFPGGGEQYDTDLKDEDLDQLDIPTPDGEGGEAGGDGLPENIPGSSESNSDQKDKGKSGSSGKGSSGSGKKDDSEGDGSEGSMAKDLDKRTQGGTKKISKSQEITFGKKNGGGSSENSSEDKMTSIGNTGIFLGGGVNVTDDDLRDAGYSDDDIKEINGVRELNKTNNSRERLQKAIDDTKKKLPPWHPVKKMMDNIEIESEKYKNVWKRILEKFLAHNTRRAGKDIPRGHNDWEDRRQIPLGRYGIHHQNLAQDPQDVNFCVDVSGSMDLELLEIIAKSLVIYAKEWKYSSMNICPWANWATKTYRIEGFYKKGEEELTKEIIHAIEEGKEHGGGGTEAKGAIEAIANGIISSLNDSRKKKKDDVNIVITDGQFIFSGIEDDLKEALNSEYNVRHDVGDKAAKNTVWMIYDASESLREEWQNEIKKGEVILIVSDVVKNNK